MKHHGSALATALVLLTGCGSGGGGAEPDPSASDEASTASADIEGTFDVGGRDLAIACVGTGAPTVVLESGDGVPSEVMGDALAPRLSPEHRVCTYDRAGMGLSEGGNPRPRSSTDVLGDLRGLLEAAEVPGPYVLVGHSAGGMLVQAYARAFPDEVAGVVALNPVPPWAAWRREAFGAMTPAERDEETAYFGGDGSDEGFDFREISTSTMADAVPAEVPLHLLISTIEQCDSPRDICGRTYPAYTATMRAIARDWPRGRYTQVASGHEIYLDDPAAAMAAVTDVLDRAASAG